MFKLVKQVAISCMIGVTLTLAPSYAYAADAEDWANLFGWQSTIAGHLQLIYGEIQYANDILIEIRDTINGSIQATVQVNFPDISGPLVDIAETNRAIRDYLINIYNAMGYTSPTWTHTLKDDLTNIYSKTQSAATGILTLVDVLIPEIYQTQTDILAAIQGKEDTEYDYTGSLTAITTNIGTVNSNLSNISSTLNQDFRDVIELLSNLWIFLTNDGHWSSLELLLHSLNYEILEYFNARNDFKTLYELIDTALSSNRVIIDNQPIIDAITSLKNSNFRMLDLISSDIQKLLAALVIGQIADSVMGDFDEDAFSDNVARVGAAASSKMPFCAMYAYNTLFSSIPLFSGSGERIHPMLLNFDFFGGQSHDLVIGTELMWGIRPITRMSFYLIFLIALITATLKFVRN